MMMMTTCPTYFWWNGPFFSFSFLFHSSGHFEKFFFTIANFHTRIESPPLHHHHQQQRNFRVGTPIGMRSLTIFIAAKQFQVLDERNVAQKSAFPIDGRRKKMGQKVQSGQNRPKQQRSLVSVVRQKSVSCSEFSRRWRDVKFFRRCRHSEHFLFPFWPPHL